MNERIKELAKQAGAWDYYEINEGVDGDEKPLRDFADLIIRECIYQVSIDENGVAYEGAARIARYFGVE